MPASIDWLEIARRLALTVLAGTLIGLNRWERGRPAGLRTTLLVCLAAAVAMIEANLLLGTVGGSQNPAVRLDVMRLPLGILTGMGFIGAGSVLRRQDRIIGVTTAATLWFSTVIGLCLGGGQAGLGLAGLGLGLIVLWCFRWIEESLSQERIGTLTLTMAAGRSAEQELRNCLAGQSVRVISWAERASADEHTVRCEVRWKAPNRDGGAPAFLRRLADRSDLVAIDWNESVHSES